MKRWDYTVSEDVEAPDIDIFLRELIQVCRNHNMSITHEDVHGAFIIYRGFDENSADALLAAHIGASGVDPRSP